jgi:hypothetical protein
MLVEPLLKSASSVQNDLDTKETSSIYYA